MSGAGGLGRRVARIEGAFGATRLRAWAEQLAVEVGVPVAEVLAEAEAAAAEIRATGGLTVRQIADRVAQEHGLDPAEVLAETVRILEELRR